MTKQKPLEVITPPNMLKVKTGGQLPKFDERAVARAEQALKQLAHQFDDWMNEEVAKLEAAYAALAGGPVAGEAGETLFRAAHDIKGLGSTYEFPLVTRLAASFCRLIETEGLRKNADASLVRAHVEAIRAAVRDGVRTEDHPVGKLLLTELESRVARALAA